MYIYICVYIYKYKYIHIYMYTYMYIFTYIYIYINIYVNIYSCIHIHMYTYIHIHSYMYPYLFVFCTIQCKVAAMYIDSHIHRSTYTSVPIPILYINVFTYMSLLASHDICSNTYLRYVAISIHMQKLAATYI